MTLQECKDQVAKDVYGHADWKTFIADGLDWRVYRDAADEVAELYAQSKIGGNCENRTIKNEEPMTELSKLTPAQESNKLRDEILDLLERHTNPALAVYPLLHFFEGKIREMKAEHRKKIELAFDAGYKRAWMEGLIEMPELEKVDDKVFPNKDQWIKEHL